jgi:hypothetical protein
MARRKGSPEERAARAAASLRSAFAQLAEAAETLARKVAAGEPVGRISVKVTRRKSGRKAPRTKVVIVPRGPRAGGGRPAADS